MKTMQAATTSASMLTAARWTSSSKRSKRSGEHSLFPSIKLAAVKKKDFWGSNWSYLIDLLSFSWPFPSFLANKKCFSETICCNSLSNLSLIGVTALLFHTLSFGCRPCNSRGNDEHKNFRHCHSKKTPCNFADFHGYNSFGFTFSLIPF